MRYVEITCETGIPQTESVEYVAFPNETNCDIIADYAEELMDRTAENYAYLVAEEAEENGMTPYEWCYENMCYSWEIITKEEWENNNGHYC